MELDARVARDGTTLDGDVCIVGAGPAGLTLAEAMRKAGRQVVLLESGGFEPDPAAQEFNAGHTSDDPYHDRRLALHRRVGGTSWIWNTVMGKETGAKYVPLDPIDFERRDWLPWSGWPFGRADVDPYYRRAHEVCGLGPWDYAGLEEPSVAALDGSRLVNAVYRFGSWRPWVVDLPNALRATPGAVLVHGATVTGLQYQAGGDRVAAVEWKALTGRTGVVRCKVFVLATGGIENARLLLLSPPNRKPRGGEGHGWIGRGFTEHPRDLSRGLNIRNQELSPRRGFYALHRAASGHAIWGRLGLSEELLRAEKLVNASVTLLPDDRPPLPGLPIRRVARLWARARAAVRPTCQLLLNVEQAPHPENRVILSGRPDPLGHPGVEVQWRWRAEDQANLDRIYATIAREFQVARLGRVRVWGKGPPDPQAYHPSGTTRMHVDPEQGVVDEHCRVHGVENLYVTGSSVFPTVGFANPTLTIIALALRLGDHLVRSS